MNIKYTIFTLIVIILFILTVLVGYDVVSIIIFPKNHPWTWNLEMYKWAGYGILGFLVVSRVFNKNLKWFATFSHELTHIIVSLLFLRKINSFTAGAGSGEVTTSGRFGTSFFVDLAPYCLPIFTYLLLVFRMMIVEDMLMYYDVIVGLSIGFHIYCFSSQTGSYQSDINSHPLFFSYLYIITFLLFNLLIIIISFWHSKNVFSAFLYVTSNMWSTFQHLLNTYVL